MRLRHTGYTEIGQIKKKKKKLGVKSQHLIFKKGRKKMIKTNQKKVARNHRTT